MPNADRKHLIAACVAAITTSHTRIPPNARLWLALASLKADPKGRTRYTPDGYSADAHDTVQSGQAAINWLIANAIIINDTDDEGEDCYRLTHHDWDRDYAVITGYSTDAGQRRDGHPPAYGRGVHDVIEPNGPRHRPEPGGTWRNP